MNRSPLPSSSITHHRLIVTGNPDRDLTAPHTVRVLLFLASQMALAVIMKQSSLVATASALAALGLGFHFLLQDEEPYRLIYLTAYILGMELLWRGSGARVFWEFGKYTIILLLVLSVLKQQRMRLATKWSILYFVLLLPSLAVLPYFDREDISFNLSGPLLLAVAVFYFSTVQLTAPQLKRALLAILGPVVGLAFLSNIVILTTASINIVVGGKATSAGIGPNQVSSILGLGALAAFFYAVLERKQPFLRLVMVGIAIWLLGQSALTLSRGGFWTAIGTILTAAIFLVRDRRYRSIFLAAVLSAYLAGMFVLLPALDNFTGGILSARLQSADLTHRDDIMRADLLAFQQHPWLGVGPGQSDFFHAITFRYSEAHTEYTRLLAEHGSLGLAALLLLLIMSIRQSGRRGLSPLSRAFVAAAIAWTLLTMAHSAMRLAAPGFMFGLAAATFILHDSDSQSTETAGKDATRQTMQTNYFPATRNQP